MFRKRAFLIILTSFLSSCSSMEFTKRNVLTGIAVGAALGAASTLVKDDNRLEWAALGAGVGGALGSLAVVGMSSGKSLEKDKKDYQFFKDVMTNSTSTEERLPNE